MVGRSRQRLVLELPARLAPFLSERRDRGQVPLRFADEARFLWFLHASRVRHPAHAPITRVSRVTVVKPACAKSRVPRPRAVRGPRGGACARAEEAKAARPPCTAVAQC